MILLSPPTCIIFLVLIKWHNKPKWLNFENFDIKFINKILERYKTIRIKIILNQIKKKKKKKKKKK